jgi:hypothetical protein
MSILSRWFKPRPKPTAAFIPELWAKESLKVLEEHMVVGGLVRRDFSDPVRVFNEPVATLPPLVQTDKSFEVIRDIRNPY